MQDILLQREIPILDSDNQDTLFNKLSLLGASLINDVIEKLDKNEIIQNTNPMLDDYHTGIRSADDIRTWEEVLQLDDDSEGQFAWGDYTREEAEEALNLLSDDFEPITSDWKLRYQMNLDLLKKGTVKDIAAIVRCLYNRSKVKELPILERKLYDSAKRLLEDEISFALGKNPKDIEAAIHTKLEPLGSVSKVKHITPLDEDEDDDLMDDVNDKSRDSDDDDDMDDADVTSTSDLESEEEDFDDDDAF